MKQKISPRAALIVTVIAVFLILSGILLAKYIEAWFLILVGWILIPVFIKKVYDRFTKERRHG